MTNLTSIFENEIKQIVPNAKKYMVKIERDHDLYCSKMHVQLPGAVLHAQKKGQTAWEALKLSYKAISKQVLKIKKRHKKKKPMF